MTTFDMEAFRTRVQQRVDACARLYGEEPPTPPSLLRIVEGEPGYVPLITDVAAIADALKCSMAELFGELALGANDIVVFREMRSFFDRLLPDNAKRRREQEQ